MTVTMLIESLATRMIIRRDDAVIQVVLMHGKLHILVAGPCTGPF